MTPQELQRMTDLEEQIKSLTEMFQSLTSETTIPKEVENAFRIRLGIDYFASLDPSTKTGSSETRAVNEAGVATYNVAKPPAGFRQFTIGGTTFYVPYYT